MTAAVQEARHWSGQPPEIDPVRLLRVHRYADPEKVRPQIRDAAERVAREVSALAAPVAVYMAVPIADCRDGVLRLETGSQFHCPAFDRLMKDAREVIAFVLTLGPAVDARVVELMDEFEPLDALFVEAAGWLSIEAATRDLGGHLRQEIAGSGRSIAHRMGPGYSYRSDQRDTTERVGWPLEEQATLFELFAGTELPVELLPSAAMLPKMSRSGLFGVTAEA